jgi:hypothetical protein
VADPDPVNPLVGSWRVLSAESRTEAGEVSYPYGRDAVGYLVYTPEGRMAAFLERARRPPFASGDLLSAAVEEQASVATTFIAYCGTYEWRGDRVVHRVEISSFPNWEGGVQERLVEVDDDRLTLRTGPILIGGTRRESVLIWARIG